MTTHSKQGNDPENGLIQLHWQDLSDPQTTLLVAQGGPFRTPDELEEWIRSAVAKSKTEFPTQCPDGWVPMLCDSTSSYFAHEADKVLPCPCCGSVDVKIAELNADQTGQFFVTCMRCVLRTGLSISRPDVISAWNRRDGDACRHGCKITKAVREMIDSVGT